MPAILTLTTADGQLIASVTMPTSWADVTLAQYLALIGPDSPGPDSVLTGLSPEVLRALSEEDRSQLLELLLFLTDTEVLRELVPTPGLYELGRCAYGLHCLAHKHLDAHPDLSGLAQGAYLYALFRAPTGGTATPGQVAAAHAAVLAAPVAQVYADCCYFLASWERSQNGTSFDGPEQPGLLRVVRSPAPTGPASWLARLGNLWNPSKTATA